MMTFVLMSCEDNDVDPPTDGQFEMNFQMNWEGNDFSLFEQYENVSEYLVSVERIKFYISDIQLIKEDNSLVDVSDIELFDMNEDDMSESFDIPEGSYKGMKYSWGVTQDLNGTTDPDNFDPVMYGPEHPLNESNNMYWAWATGYRFFIFDGRFDQTPLDTTDLLDPFSIHTGTDATFTPIEANNIMFSFNRENDVKFNIDVDISKAFYNAGDTINLSLPEDNQAHQTNIQLSERLMQNIKAATSHSVD